MTFALQTVVTTVLASTTRLVEGFYRDRAYRTQAFLAKA